MLSTSKTYSTAYSTVPHTAYCIHSTEDVIILQYCMSSTRTVYRVFYSNVFCSEAVRVLYSTSKVL